MKIVFFLLLLMLFFFGFFWGGGGGGAEMAFFGVSPFFYQLTTADTRVRHCIAACKTTHS